MAARLSFSEIELGRRLVGPGRTIGEADLTFFAMLTGDWNPIHADADYARSTRIGQRILHGTWGVAVAMGMVANIVEFTEPVIGMLDLRDWRFLRPLLVGSTVHVELEFVSKRVTSDGERGILDRRIALSDDAGIVIQEGRSAMMLGFARGT
jgi:acyl dehydratase